MWCTRCHADVAGRLAENGQALNCASCGHELQKIYTPSLHPEIRSARELLERWSREERIGPPLPSLPEPAGAIEAAVPSSTAAPTLERSPAPRTFASELQKHLPESNDAAPRSAELISTNLDTDKPTAPATAPKAAAPAEATKPADAGSASAAGAADQKPRKLLDRPAISRTAKPKTVWRADSPHAPAVAANGDEIPKSVAPLQSIDTLAAAAPSPVPPLPTRPAKAIPPSAALTGGTDPLTLATQGRSSTTNRGEDRASAAAAESVSAHESPRARPLASPGRRSSGSRRQRFDNPEAAVVAPHFDLQTYVDQHPQKAGRSETLWGQLVAYAGVAVLTVGTTMVLWGYFGGLGKYTSTGFLISTAGQMLLFLGVVTLVSGGMQQTSQDVSTRVEYLGDRMIRMEQATQQILRSPHFARRRRRQRGGAEAAATPKSRPDQGAADAA